MPQMTPFHTIIGKNWQGENISFNLSYSIIARLGVPRYQYVYPDTYILWSEKNNWKYIQIYVG